MKTRMGFVSNSSTSSFIAYGYKISYKDYDKIFNICETMKTYIVNLNEFPYLVPWENERYTEEMNKDWAICFYENGYENSPLNFDPNLISLHMNNLQEELNKIGIETPKENEVILSGVIRNS